MEKNEKDVPAMKIAYIEIDTHPEILNRVYKIAEKSGIEIKFFISEKIKKSTIDIEKAVVVTPKSLIPHLEKFQPELVICGTVHRHFNIFNEITEKFKTAIIVHNKNFSSAKKITLFTSVFKEDILYRIKLLLKENLLKVPKVFSKATSLLVLDSSLADQRFLYLPIFYREYASNCVDKKNEIIVIPGTVSKKRRDYFHAIDVFKNSTKIKTTLVLAGKTERDMLPFLQEQSQAMQAEKKIIFFEDKVSNAEFNKILNDSYALWAPLNQDTYFFSVKEKYGFTKMSGTYGDAVSFGRLMIIPDWYPKSESFMITETEFFNGKTICANFEKFSEYSVIEHFTNVIQNIVNR